ncbi:hypothetical protein BIW11_13775, partial [Tropilaelaps mercedesae]
MAECLSAQALQLPRAASLDPATAAADIKKELDDLTLDDKMVMLQDGAGGKDSATLLRDILEKEKQLGSQHNNNAGEHTEDSGTDDKAPSPLRSPPSSTQSDAEDEDEREIREARESIELNESHSERDDLPVELQAAGRRSPALVSGGPAPPPNVNGCKKRKLYQPSRQTVENGDALAINDDDDDDGLDDEVPVKRSEDREALRTRLREQYERLSGDGAHVAGLERNTDLERLVAVLKSEITHTLTQVIDNIVSRFVPRLAHPDQHQDAANLMERRPALQSLARHELALRERNSSPPPPPPPPGAALGLRGPNPPSNFDLSRPESFLALAGSNSLANQRDIFAQMLDRKAKSKVIDRGVSLPTSVAIPNPSLHHELFLSQLEHQQRLSAPFTAAGHPEASGAGEPATPEPRAAPAPAGVPPPTTTSGLPPGTGQTATLSQRAVSQATGASSPADAFGLYLQRAALNKSLRDPSTAAERDALAESAAESASAAAAAAAPTQLPSPYDVMNIFNDPPFGALAEFNQECRSLSATSALVDGVPNPVSCLPLGPSRIGQRQAEQPPNDEYFNGAGGTNALSALSGSSSSPFCPRTTTPGDVSHEGSATPASETSSYSKNGSLGGSGYTSTLTPMHLRKAKLMFFYVRYPSSAILKMYFPDINFNKNNTAQLVKWFSNF